MGLLRYSKQSREPAFHFPLLRTVMVETQELLSQASNNSLESLAHPRGKEHTPLSPSGCALFITVSKWRSFTPPGFVQDDDRMRLERRGYSRLPRERLVVSCARASISPTPVSEHCCGPHIIFVIGNDLLEQIFIFCPQIFFKYIH